MLAIVGDGWARNGWGERKAEGRSRPGKEASVRRLCGGGWSKVLQEEREDSN